MHLYIYAAARPCIYTSIQLHIMALFHLNYVCVLVCQKRPSSIRSGEFHTFRAQEPGRTSEPPRCARRSGLVHQRGDASLVELPPRPEPGGCPTRGPRRGEDHVTRLPTTAYAGRPVLACVLVDQEIERGACDDFRVKSGGQHWRSTLPVDSGGQLWRPTWQGLNSVIESEVGATTPVWIPQAKKSCFVFVLCVTCEAARPKIAQQLPSAPAATRQNITCMVCQAGPGCGAPRHFHHKLLDRCLWCGGRSHRPSFLSRLSHLIARLRAPSMFCEPPLRFWCID